MARILIVDDNPNTVAEVSAILSDAGHQIAARHETADLASVVRETGPDLIILDNHFPEDDHAGIKAARALSADPQLCQVPILMLTGLNRSSGLPFRISEADISEDFLPIDGFIDKPVQAEALLEKVEALLHPEHEPPVRRCRSGPPGE